HNCGRVASGRRSLSVAFCSPRFESMRRALLLLMLCLPAFVRADEPVRFLIERIEVRHLLHASPDVIRAESRLREGESYTEGELRDATNSIRSVRIIRHPAFT